MTGMLNDAFVEEMFYQNTILLHQLITDLENLWSSLYYILFADKEETS